MRAMSTKARAFLIVNALLGLAVITYAVLHWHSDDIIRLAAYLAVALIASGLKIHLPGVNGTMSVVFLFVLLGNTELSLGECLLVGCSATVLQSVWRVRRRPQPVQMVFNVCSWAYAIGASYLVYNSLGTLPFAHNLFLLLASSALTFFVANTVPVAVIIGLTERKNFRQVWSECYFWSFPYYLLGAAIAGVVTMTDRSFGWSMIFVVLPVGYLIYRSYRLYLDRLENEKKHVEEMAALHLRTIEALAIAIDAKDHSTHAHLNRVRTYAVAVGEELGLDQSQLEALRAAALLHDIGKLAVPEHIINKPSKLTAEEFEKMKIHPTVGAEILKRISFPYPVVPIVYSHHERWDGTGYPVGLRGEEIPIGARILAVVDCFDALVSDRQYRRALDPEAAMAIISAEAGTGYDPRIVAVLENRHNELECLMQEQSEPESADAASELPGNMAVPSAGLESAQLPEGADFLNSIAAARQEGHMLFELTNELGTSLSLNETLSVLCVRLSKMVPYDSVAVWMKVDGKLVPEYVSGDNFRMLSSLRIPLGEGLSGWVAVHRKPIINGNPLAEPGYEEANPPAGLRSALSIPLEGVDGLVGVLTLYSSRRDAFTADHLRILLAVSSRLALSMENALKYRIAEDSATIDHLTSLPNARSLFLQLDREVARSKRTGETVAVLVCDLDGFKQVNDKFGHLQGNRVLQLFAQKLKAGCREYDYAARMGGDEFVVIVPGLRPENLGETAARLQTCAVEAGREVCGQDILSISVGYARCPYDGADAEQLLTEADRRMYVVKQQHHEVQAIGFDHFKLAHPAFVN